MTELHIFTSVVSSGCFSPVKMIKLAKWVESTVSPYSLLIAPQVTVTSSTFLPNKEYANSTSGPTFPTVGYVLIILFEIADVNFVIGLI